MHINNFSLFLYLKLRLLYKSIQCFCGNYYGKYKKNNDSLCNMNCVGDKSIKCGSSYKNSVYEIVYEQTTIAIYLGCFIDASSARDLNGYSKSSYNMNKQQCLLICSKNHFKYFGLQYALVKKFLHYINIYTLRVSECACKPTISYLNRCYIAHS